MRGGRVGRSSFVKGKCAMRQELEENMELEEGYLVSFLFLMEMLKQRVFQLVGVDPISGQFNG